MTIRLILKNFQSYSISCWEIEPIAYVDLYPEFMGMCRFGMSYCKTDECKELISGYSVALMVLKNKTIF